MLLVRSYRTVASLPVRIYLHRRSNISVALALGLPPPAVNWHLALRSSDFPPVGPCGTPPAIVLFTFLRTTLNYTFISSNYARDLSDPLLKRKWVCIRL